MNTNPPYDFSKYPTWVGKTQGGWTVSSSALGWNRPSDGKWIHLVRIRTDGLCQRWDPEIRDWRFMGLPDDMTLEEKMRTLEVLARMGI
jgi:hypothetical protein